MPDQPTYVVVDGFDIVLRWKGQEVRIPIELYMEIWQAAQERASGLGSTPTTAREADPHEALRLLDELKQKSFQADDGVTGVEAGAWGRITSNLRRSVNELIDELHKFEQLSITAANDMRTAADICENETDKTAKLRLEKEQLANANEAQRGDIAALRNANQQLRDRVSAQGQELSTLKQKVSNLKDELSKAQSDRTEEELAKVAADQRAEQEKSSRVKYQDIVYQICNLMDSLTDSSLVTKTTIDEVVGRVEELKQEAQKVAAAEQRAEQAVTDRAAAREALATITGVTLSGGSWNETCDKALKSVLEQDAPVPVEMQELRQKVDELQRRNDQQAGMIAAQSQELSMYKNNPKSGVGAIFAERMRQINEEGWSSEHDDKHLDCELARAASCYAMPGGWRILRRPNPNAPAVPTHWPWAPNHWKPDDRRRELVKAGALIAAEIDRFDRFQRAVTLEHEGD